MVVPIDEKSKKKTILVCVWNGVGHVNGVLGAISSIIKRGHRVVFVIEKAFKGRLAPFGVEEYIYEANEKEFVEEKPAERWANLFETHKIFGKNCSDIERLQNFASWIGCEETISDLKVLDKVIEKAINELNPDLFVLEELYLLPSIFKSQKPWIKCLTAHPSYFLKNENIPPWGTGYSCDTDPSEWKAYRELLEEVLEPSGVKEMKKIDPNYPENLEIVNQNLRLVTYALPKELSYPQLKSIKYFNLEINTVLDSSKIKNFNLEKLTGKKFLENDLNGEFSGKLVYLSMGSMVSCNIDLMKKLVSALAKTKHKYLISKGLRHDEYELASNMWGDAFIPQLDLLPLVDLVITHGGHNTVTETFFYGKPMIVFPSFADQFNNGQRLQETGLGIRLDTYNFTENELIRAVDKLIYDKELNQRLKLASDRLRNSDSHDQFADLVEEILA